MNQSSNITPEDCLLIIGGALCLSLAILAVITGFNAYLPVF